MTESRLQTIEIPAESEESAIIVALHGRGSDPQDMAGLARALAIPTARWVVPAAPIPMGGGYTWYQRPYTDISPENRAEFNHARDLLKELTENLRVESPESPIILIGFSQGGVLALDSDLRSGEPISGAAVLSGGLYDPDSLHLDMSEPAREIPIFWAHGTHDSILPVEPARRHSGLLKSLGIPLSFNEYPIDHSISAEVIKDVRSFLRSIVKEK